MSARLTLRRVGLLLQSASLAAVGLAIVILAVIVFGRDRADDIHGYGLLFGSIFLAALSAIGLIGVFGLVLWWRTGRDTPVIAYDVFVLLFAAQFLQPAFDELQDARKVDLAVLAPWVILIGFLVLTFSAALVVYRTRPAPTEPSSDP